MKSTKLITLFSLLLFLPLNMSAAYASVVMSTTRVIYNEGVKSASIQLKNNDEFPYLIQAWTDEGDESSLPDTQGGPVIALPSLFKVYPKAGQSIRIVIDNAKLPKDKESVFFLNALQIPAQSNSDASRNKMVVMVKNRIKVFYRPKSIMGSSDQAGESLSFSMGVNAGRPVLVVKNPSSYHVSLSRVEVRSAGGKGVTVLPEMISPQSNRNLHFENKVSMQANKPLDITYFYVNDYGAEVKAVKHINNL
ncbi:fimbrial chaperone protein [Aeromonas sp. CA23]|uniref:fimbrial biogenesis chaperone n=1 Tax=Aeromonas sp. CA23 TaxID=2033032 RepID=UPI000BFD37F0|nr:molecular chaperone [Aeromonas sp. CA23]ATM00995.1 fimbrial chaperone protein [Aeromonas sp. CA23]